MTLASGSIYLARADGSLWTLDFTQGRPVPGSLRAVGGTGLAARGMFLLSP
jgi:hypothetical protein